MFNTLKYYKLWFVISALILIFGIVSLLTFGLKLGIDFTGGSLIEVKFKQSANLDAARQALLEASFEGVQLQATEGFGVLVKTRPLTKEEHDKAIDTLKTKVGDLEEIRFDSIGPVVGNELKGKAFYQLVLVSAGILIYLGYAFRKVAKPVSSWKFGVAAVVALFHDLFFLLGVFSILGHYKGIEVDSMFVTAVLTVLGFSVHDTIVVFDRIRENLKLYAGRGMDFIVNHSIAQSIVRSLNTSLTVLFVLLSLLLFGGESIRYFILALFIGIIVGTYSSIFIASPVLMLMQRKK